MKGEVHGWSCYATLAGLAGPSRLFSCNQLSVPLLIGPTRGPNSSVRRLRIVGAQRARTLARTHSQHSRARGIRRLRAELFCRRESGAL